MSDESRIISILELFPFYHSISQSFKRKVLAAAEYATLPVGAYYFEEGQYCGNFALLGSGDIRVFKRGENGREITLYHVERGETCILTASCVLGHSDYPASAVIDSAAEAVVFPSGIFRDWVASNDEIRQFVFSAITHRMEGVLALIAEITFRKMDERLALFLSEKVSQSPKQNLVHMTHGEIAIELGTAREVVSRLLKDFERKGWLKQTRGQLEIYPGMFS